MTTYLLDTNACIALINGTEINVRRRFKRAVARESVILLSSIVAFELWYGVAKSQRKDSNTQRLETFLGGPLEWALFDEDDARALVLPAERDLHRCKKRRNRKPAVTIVDLDVRLVVHIGAQDDGDREQIRVEPVGHVDAADIDLTIGFAAQRFARDRRRIGIIGERHSR